MRIRCKKCKTLYEIDAGMIQEKGSKVRCSTCKDKFRVYPPKINEHTESVPSDETDAPLFLITDNDKCPLYEAGDQFQLKGSVFVTPENKAPCMILIRDVAKILKNSEAGFSGRAFSCSGCSGSIVFKETSKRAKEHYKDTLARILSNFAVFEGIFAEDIRTLIDYLKLDKYAGSDIILRKGDPGRNLFIIVSGNVEVLNEDGLPVASMIRGDVFGEMSLLTGGPVGATVKAVTPTSLLRLDQTNFKSILERMPSLQKGLLRMLVRRMNEINALRSHEFASSLAGKLSEMPPADLFQAFNINQKTGVLTLNLSHKSARLVFRDGQLVDARYEREEGEDAFFEMLKLRDGRFNYHPGLPSELARTKPIGDFMYLLIEGLRRIEDDDKRFLHTMIPDLV
ncbi:cyclic nucleotide-binding domain-containing protein [Desulfobacterales bacterium HSG16]|nr:cyclic nucleotide-binding domain-containing protein [Desulfobacterales bacterium HSG16]